MSKYTPRSSTTQPTTATYARGRGSQPQNPDYEEFASLQLDKPNEAELKTTEEMKKHMFDDHFEGRPIERAMHILSGGEEVQRLSVIRDLPQLLLADEDGCMQRVVPKIQQALNNATTEFHIEAARSYSIILQRKAVSPNTFAQNFLPIVIYHADNRDPVASGAWLETLLYVVEVLPLDIVKNTIFGVAINKGQISQNVAHRIAACKLLGKISARFESNLVKKDILPVVLSLCQDVNEAVRATICSQLHIVAKGVPLDMVKSALIPILVELGRDEIVQVRVEAIETIVKIIPLLNPELLKMSIIPLMKKICEQAAVSLDETLVMVAKQFGSLCIGLEAILTPAEKVWLVTYYHNLSHMGIPLHGAKKDVFISSHNLDRINARYIECRQYCAYNFPAMAKFCSSSPDLLEKIYPSLCDFSTDPFYMVRKTVGAGLHEVARILGKNNRVVKNQVMTLLWDNMEEVLMGIVPNLGKTIDSLISSGVLGQEQDAGTFELGRGLLQCDKTIRDKTHNWRLYTSFITQLESVVKCLPSDYIYSHFVALMFDKMHRARPLPCRLAAARTLLVYLRYNMKNNQRQEIRSRLQSEFCLSSSCYKRMLFLRLCSTARELFSRAYFKEHFFYPLLSRSEDRVPNNRLLLIRQFPSLKAMLVMPQEKKYLQTLESCIRSMAINEKDKDVTAELRSVILKLERVETLVDSGTPSQSLDDIEDRRRLDEELKIANNTFRHGNVPPSQARVQRPDVKTDPKAEPRTDARQPTRSVDSSKGPGGTGSASSSSSTVGSRTDRVGSYVSGSGHPISSSFSSQSGSYSGNVQGYSNTTNTLITARAALSSPSSASGLTTNKSNTDSKCTCYPGTGYFRSENLRNLNLLALIDANFVNSKQKLSELIQKKLSQDPRLKMSKSSRHSMEISWLNLETDLKNELFALVRSRQLQQGDRNFKEKSKFLTDFRNYNESTLHKFISDDRDYRETIYSVTGVGSTSSGTPAGYEKTDSSFFEERLNFFERKLKMDTGKGSNSETGDCSCFELTTTNRVPPSGDPEDTKKFSYFSKNFEEDFYRDAGVKPNEIIGRKLSGIPVYDRPTMQGNLGGSRETTPATGTTKASNQATWNKRRTWFGAEGATPSPVKLENITGYAGRRGLERKKSETLPPPPRENVSLKNLGIGPRSKSFVLPSTGGPEKKTMANGQGVNFRPFGPTENGHGVDKVEAKEPGGGTGSGPVSGSHGLDGPSRFGFRPGPRVRDESLKVDGKPVTPKTRIPVGRLLGDASPASSRSSSPIAARDKPDESAVPGKPSGTPNGTKRIPVIASRKSMLIQSTAARTDVKNNRRSLDSTKISLAALDKVGGGGSGGGLVKKKPMKNGGDADAHTGNVRDEKVDGSNSGFSKLPVRRPRPDKS